MSETDAQTAEGGDITTTVQIVGYAPSGFSDFRTWANRFDDGRDYSEKEVVDKGEYVATANGKVLNVSSNLAEKMADMDTGDIEVEYEEKLVEEYNIGKRSFGSHIRTQLADELPPEVLGWDKLDGWLPKYGDDVGEDRVKIYRRVGESKVLKVASERTEDGRYEEDGYERPYVSIKAKYKDVSRDDLQALDVMVTETITAFMMNHDAFGPVRAEECKTVMMSEGSCTNL